MNIRQNVQDLLSKTTSNAVKDVCQKYLASFDGGNGQLLEQKLLADLQVVGGDEANSLIQEIRGYSASITGMQNKISKNAAQRLMESSWAGVTDKTTSNVGNFKDNTIATGAANAKTAETALLEGLKTITETTPETIGVVEAATLADYGVSKGVAKIASSKIYSHPSVKYATARIQNLLDAGHPESAVVKEFISEFHQYAWDPTVNEAYSVARKALEARAAIVEVQNALSSIRSTDRTGFYTEPVKVMNEWLGNSKRNTAALLRDLKAWVFHPTVKQLYNDLSMQESNNGGKFSLPVADANCNVSPVYSPVLFEKGSQVFRAGSRFFRSTGDAVAPLTEAQVNALPASFHALCENFFNNNVRVADGDVVVYLNKNKVRITSDRRVFVNENRIDAADMGRTLLYYTNANFMGGEAAMVGVCQTLVENIDTICEIDFAQSLTSNLYEGLGITVMKKGGKVFINKVNPSMKEDKFFEATATQAIKMVRETLSYDISDSFSDMLVGEQKALVNLRSEMNAVLENIKVLEGEIQKIERAVLDDPYLSEVDAIAEAKATLEKDLGTLHSMWQQLSAALKEAEAKPETAEVDPIEIADQEEEENETPEEEAAESPEEQEAEAAAGTEAGMTDKSGQIEVDVDVQPETGEAPAVDVEVEPATEVTPGAEPTPTTDAGVQDAGLLGAGGAQDATIKGNDNAAVVTGQPAATGSVVDAGFSGAEGTQQQTGAIPGAADVTAIATGNTATETGTSVFAVAPSAPSAPVDEEPTDAEVAAPETETEETEPKGEEPVEGEEEGEEKEELEEKKNLSEKLGPNSKVKIAGTDTIGEIQSVDGDTYMVLVDGKVDEYKEGQLQSIDDKIEKDEEDKEKEGATEEEPVMQENTVTPGEGQDTEQAPQQAYVKGKITIDFGDFRKGDSIEIDALGYTSGGDEDPVKLKEPKGDITSIPKKYIQIEDVKAEPAKPAEAPVTAAATTAPATA